MSETSTDNPPKDSMISFNTNINVRYWNVYHKKLLSCVQCWQKKKKKALEAVERAHFTWFITENVNDRSEIWRFNSGHDLKAQQVQPALFSQNKVMHPNNGDEVKVPTDNSAISLSSFTVNRLNVSKKPVFSSTYSGSDLSDIILVHVLF